MNKEEKRGKPIRQTSRREFLKDAGLIVGGATVGSIGILNACSKGIEQPSAVASNVTGNTTNAVVEPITSPSVTKIVDTTNSTNNFTSNVSTPVTVPPVTKAAETTQAPAAVDLELFNPAGNQEITQFFAPRLSTLEGKTVAFLASDPVKWQPHRIFPVIMEELKKLYTTINFLPMDQFPMGTTISGDNVIKLVADKHPDAVFIGSAG